MIVLAERSASIDSNNGTGIRPGSSGDPATWTLVTLASRITFITSVSDSAPLMM